MLIILDRDGVINEDSDAYIKSPDEWVPIPGSLETIGALTQAGHTIVVATNQSGVARGLLSAETLQAIHDKLHRLIQAHGGRIDHIYVCPHSPDEQCRCRKPAPGLFEQIRIDYPLLFETAITIGDSWRDLEAAHAAGCHQLYLVLTGKGSREVQKTHALQSQVHIVSSLAAVFNNIFD
ncbi:MAG: D-glycero-beta-D-manno-heptose-1,7-bisphosphate 7-phosphatase [Gammaproteobacteria bacterium RIFCSPHIGHO2_12_FULL_45_9]|nr:MAG: D-glycero-beta-D-manno-heptose-1,7-bisphosphate 7-phosphatase [Gammaproteobacteria bacterium RIFCSPHIGHO2_12_FULL_45_9]